MAQTRHDDADQTLHAIGFRAQLFVVLDPTGGKSGGQFAVDEGCIREGLVNLGDLCAVEKRRDGQQHAVLRGRHDARCSRRGRKKGIDELKPRLGIGPKRGRARSV
jgi:hypothetical protein